jgi:hypothetical protein
MPGKTSDLSPLESRKQLLVAQSELNRAGLADEWQGMAHGVRDFSQRAKNIASWTASAALLVAGVTALRRAPPRSGAAKTSLFQRILDGARVASTLWFTFRARGDKHE